MYMKCTAITVYWLRCYFFFLSSHIMSEGQKVFETTKKINKQEQDHFQNSNHQIIYENNNDCLQLFLLLADISFGLFVT